jgi:hypothetical protein
MWQVDALCTWLLIELGNDNIAYGLCDLKVKVLRRILKGDAAPAGFKIDCPPWD